MKYICVIVILALSSAGAVPFYERAEIKKGYSGGLGLNLGAWGYWGFMEYYKPWRLELPYNFYIGGLGVTGHIHYGISERFAIFIQGFGATGVSWRMVWLEWLCDIGLGAKFQVGKKGIMKMDIGFPSYLCNVTSDPPIGLGLTYIHNFNDSRTGYIKLGRGGLGLGIAMHHRISKQLWGHTSFNLTAFPPNLSFWFNADVLRTPRDKGLEVPSKHPSFGTIAAEFTGAVVTGTVSGFALGLTLAAVTPSGGSGPLADLGKMRAFLTGATIGYPTGCAFGTYAIGSLGRRDGNFFSSLLGAWLGVPVAWGLAFAAERLEREGDGGLLLLIPAFAAPPTGAVIGYNLSRPKKPKQGTFYEHLNLPSFGFKTEKDKDGRTTTALDFRLINVRF